MRAADAANQPDAAGSGIRAVQPFVCENCEIPQLALLNEVCVDPART